MSKQQNIVKRYPIVSFAILSYVLSWWPWLVPPLAKTGFVVLPHGPSIAAIIVTAIVGGGPALKRLFSRLVPRRAHLKWYAIGMGMTIAITLVSLWLNVLLGAPAPTAEQWGTWPEQLIFFVIALLLLGAAEELGWRGFAQQRLQQGRSALGAALIVALLGVLWHLPLFVTGNIELPDVPLIFAGYVVYAWLFNRADGSVLVTMLTHAMNNTVSGEWSSLWFTGADRVRQSALLAVLWAVAAILVILLAGPKQLGRRPSEELVAAAPQPMVGG